MLRAIFYLLIIMSSSSVFAENTIQKLYKSVDHAVVELHVESLANPVVGQVEYKATKSGSLGSGVVISREGRILTAAHVIERATKITIHFADGSKSTGHVVWIDSMIDLAMIQAADMPKGLKPMPLADKG